MAWLFEHNFPLEISCSSLYDVIFYAQCVELLIYTVSLSLNSNWLTGLMYTAAHLCFYPKLEVYLYVYICISGFHVGVEPYSVRMTIISQCFCLNFEELEYVYSTRTMCICIIKTWFLSDSVLSNTLSKGHIQVQEIISYHVATITW